MGIKSPYVKTYGKPKVEEVEEEIIVEVIDQSPDKLSEKFPKLKDLKIGDELPESKLFRTQDALVDSIAEVTEITNINASLTEINNEQSQEFVKCANELNDWKNKYVSKKATAGKLAILLLITFIWALMMTAVLVV